MERDPSYGRLRRAFGACLALCFGVCRSHGVLPRIARTLPPHYSFVSGGL